MKVLSQQMGAPYSERKRFPIETVSMKPKFRSMVSPREVEVRSSPESGLRSKWSMRLIRLTKIVIMYRRNRIAMKEPCLQA